MDKVNSPEDFEKPERFKWIDDENLRVHDKHLSITELEIYDGLLGRSEDNNGHKRAFIYFRDDREFIREVSEDMRWIFDFEHVSEEELKAREIADSVRSQYVITPAAALRRRDYDKVDNLIMERAHDPSGPALVRTYTPTRLNLSKVHIRMSRSPYVVLCSRAGKSEVERETGRDRDRDREQDSGDHGPGEVGEVGE